MEKPVDKRKEYEVCVYDGRTHQYIRVLSSQWVHVTKDEDEVCQLHIGGTTLEFEGDDIECMEA